jgi:L-ascorbate metabolism protein UlaG (beta-lactamase superfamily)
MNIQYYGHSCFKINTKPAGRATEDVVVFMDPFDKSIGLKPPFGQADVVFVSHHHHDHDNVSALKGNPIVIDAPGEYSVKGINTVGIDSFHDEKEGAERGHNTIFVLETENIRLCHLGDLGTDLNPKQLEKINGVDILFIPIGGKYTIDGKKAAEISRKIEPSVIIPIHYKVPGLKIDIMDEKMFCSEMGICPKEKVSKINLKKSDLEEKNLDVVIMKVK